MRGKEIALAFFLVLLMASSAMYVFSDSGETDTSSKSPVFDSEDPLFQHEGHDHSNASQHMVGTDNFEQLDFNPLTTNGNAEVQVATTPDGETYAYLAGWNDMHIVDVTDPENTVVTGKYTDPNTQVLDVKYIEYNGSCLLYTSPSPRDCT